MCLWDQTSLIIIIILKISDNTTSYTVVIPQFVAEITNQPTILASNMLHGLVPCTQYSMVCKVDFGMILIISSLLELLYRVHVNFGSYEARKR